MARKKSNNLNKRGGFFEIFGKSKKKSKKKSKREEKTSLKKKYSKICKKECKNKKYLDECYDFNINNMCRWYDSEYNRDCNVENFYKQVNKEDLKKGVIIKKFAHSNGCSQGKGTKIKKL